MSALLNKEKRARAQKARRQRREEIIAAAAHLFERQPYSEMSLDIIGRRVGAAKGLASLHFPTREDLFLEVLKRWLAEWFDEIEQRLQDAAEPPDADALASLLAADLAGRPTLTRLVAVLHNAMEQNVEVMSAQDFVDWIRERSLALARTIEERCAGFGPGDGPPFLRRLAAVVVGLRQTASPSGMFAALLLDEGFAPFKAEIEDELRTLLSAIHPTRI
jgi:AcrR family transcriptional regulator